MARSDTTNPQNVASAFKKLNTADQIPTFSQHLFWIGWAALIIVAAFIAGVGYIVIDADKRAEEIRLKQSTDLVVQTMEARILGTAEILQKTSVRLMHGPNLSLLSASATLSASTLMDDRREVLEIAIINKDGKVESSWASGTTPTVPIFQVGQMVRDNNMPKLIKQVCDKDSSAITDVYSRKETSRLYVNLLIPTPSRTQVLVARIDLSRLLSEATRRTGTEAYLFRIIRDSNQDGDSTDVESGLLSGPMVYKAPIVFLGLPFYEHASLEGRSYAHALFTTNRLQFFAISSLGLVLLCTVGLLFYYQRLQHSAHSLLATEYSLRRAMADSAVLGLRVTDPEGKILYVNETFQKIVGYPAEELIGRKPPYPYWSDNLSSQLTRSLKNMNMTSGVPIGFRAKRKNGERFYAEIRLSPLFDSNKQCLGLIGALHDVSEQVQARTRLQDANERFNLVVQSLNSCIAVIRETEPHELLFANKAYQDTFGSNSHGIVRLLSKVASNPSAQAVGDRIYDDETHRWYAVRRQSIYWTAGEQALLTIAADITERQELEIVREAQLRRAETTQRLVTMGEMASSIAHELNQPLAAIANYAGGALSRLKEGILTQEQSLLAFDKIENQVMRADSIIKRIRGFATKKSEPRLEPTSVAHVIQETMELGLIQASKLGCDIRVVATQGLPLLYCDSVMIEQLLLNLTKNAMEAAQDFPNKTIEIVVQPQDKLRVRFTVTDHGPGIPDDKKKKLFDAFYSTKSTGMGMGLNICRSIAELHGSQIDVSDTPGGGTTFTFTVPVYDESQAHLHEQTIREFST